MDQIPSDIQFSVKRGSPARLEGRRMTGSAYQAMDVVSSCESYLQRRGPGEEMAVIFSLGTRLADCFKMLYIYIYIYIRKLNFLRSRFGEVFGEVLERFLERFWRGLGRGFREVLGEVLKRFCIPKSY